MARHAFTTRAPAFIGKSRPPAAIDADGWDAIGALVDLPGQSVVRVRQVHGVGVHIAVARPANAESDPADILLSADPDVAVSVRVADCAPILIADPAGPVAAVHSGWRGTAAGAAAAAVRALEDRYGSRPADLIAALGPSIGPCCYQVGADVVDRFAEGGFDVATLFEADTAGRFRLDMWAANRLALEAAGLAASRVHVSRLCTACDTVTFTSYRMERSGADRLVAVIRSGPPSVSAEP